MKWLLKCYNSRLFLLNSVVLFVGNAFLNEKEFDDLNKVFDNI